MSEKDNLRPIGVTLGEPAGVGPDLFAMLVTQHHFRQRIVVITDPELLYTRAKAINIDLTIHEIQESDLATLGSTAQQSKKQVHVLPITLPKHNTAQQVIPGQPSITTAHWVLATIKKAVQLCTNAQLCAMVTAPVQKSIINEAGLNFTGHTEFIADCVNHALKTQSEPLMMLTSGQHLPRPLRVALATTHHPLHQVVPLIKTKLITEKIQSLHQWLRDFYGLTKPRILVAGLNPHAGEQGYLGQEERGIIEPCIALAQQKGIDAIGPLPADTLFTPQYLNQADAVLAMYHDQGLPVLKYASFGGGINVTLGLPIVRTSVDHGTALKLAGTHKADPSSLRAAIQEACSIVDSRVSALP